MGKNKHKHFAENLTFPNFFQDRYEQLQEGFKYKGCWADSFFKNRGPVTLEVGCGKGEYTVHLAKKYPERNFVGIDVKGARMWRGAKDSEEAGLRNTAFIRSHTQNIGYFFEKGEVDQIWIPFADPQPNKPSQRKRLTSPQLLSRYAGILSTDHIIHVKTDSLFLFEYTLDVIQKEGHKLIYHTFDLYNSGIQEDVTEVQTFYENQFLAEGHTIKYLKFRLNGF